MYKNRNIRRINPVKLVSNDTVDKDVQSMLLPLNLMQNIIFYPKYRIKNGVITPNSLFSKIVSMIATLVFIFGFVHFSYTALTTLKGLGHPTFMHVVSCYNCIFYCFGVVLNFMIELFRTKRNVQFVLKFQKVHRFINNQSGFNNIIIWTWIIVIVILSIYGIAFTYLNTKIASRFHSNCYVYILIVFDFNIVYITRILRFLENEVVLWNIRDFNPHEIENMHGGNYHNRALQAYVEIMQCYDMFKHIFQEFVSNLLLLERIIITSRYLFKNVNFHWDVLLFRYFILL